MKCADIPAGISPTHDPFVAYYEKHSISPESLARFERIAELMQRVRRSCGLPTADLAIADIGCNAGTQSFIWARRGHRVSGLDINNRLVEIAGERGRELGLDVDFRVGDARRLPWDSASMDICLMPELLEHVADWQACLTEGIRILRPGGVIYLSTTNRLCPKQMEFELPFYSWYPGSLKRRYERLAVTTRPELVNHASFPAVNWFTPYELRRWFEERGLRAWDHFDWVDTARRSPSVALAARLIRAVPPVRLLAHLATSYTMIIALKRR